MGTTSTGILYINLKSQTRELYFLNNTLMSPGHERGIEKENGLLNIIKQAILMSG